MDPGRFTGEILDDCTDAISRHSASPARIAGVIRAEAKVERSVASMDFQTVLAGATSRILNLYDNNITRTCKDFARENVDHLVKKQRHPK
jgi:hypothetical protein